jgi:hypothetical protein
MLDDPGFAKIVIFALVGMVVVLTIAVIWLAVQKNTYYVDEDGDEVRPTIKKSMPNFLKKFQKNDDDDDEELAVHAVRAMKKKPAPVNSVAKTAGSAAGAAAKTAATAAAAKTASISSVAPVWAGVSRYSWSSTRMTMSIWE